MADTVKTFTGKVVLTSAQFTEMQTAGTLQEGVEYEISDASIVTDVQVNGTTILSSGVANIPLAADGTAGAVSLSNKGVAASGGDLRTVPATYVALNNGGDNYAYHPICASSIGLATKKALGITLDSSTSNTTWTDAEKTTARNTIGAISLEEYDSTAGSYDSNVLYYTLES